MLGHFRLHRLPLVSLRRWHTLQTETVRHPIVTVLHNGHQMRMQKTWGYRLRRWFVVDDPPAGTSIVEDYYTPPRRVRTLVFDFAFQQLPFLLIATWFALMMGPYLLGLTVFGLVLGLTLGAATPSFAGLAIQQEVDGDRFDLLALMPGGTPGAYEAIAAMYARRTAPRAVRLSRWPGRILAVLLGGPLLFYTVMNSRFGPPAFLGYLLAVTPNDGPASPGARLEVLFNSLYSGAHNVGILEPLVQLGLLYGLLNVPVVLIGVAILLVEYVQMMVVGHLLTAIIWTYVPQRNAVQALAGFFVMTQRGVIVALTGWLGWPLLVRIFQDATLLPNMRLYYAVLLIALAVVFTVNELTVRLLDGWLRRLMD